MRQSERAIAQTSLSFTTFKSQVLTTSASNYYHHFISLILTLGVCTNSTAPSVSSINRILRNRAAERAAAEFARNYQLAAAATAVHYQQQQQQQQQVHPHPHHHHHQPQPHPLHHALAQQANLGGGGHPAAAATPAGLFAGKFGGDILLFEKFN